MGFREFLVFLQGAGIEAVIGFFLSFVVEWFPDWASLPAKLKRLVILLFCLLIPVAAKALELAFYGGVWGDFPATWWPVMVAGFLSFSASQVAHARKLDT